MAVSSIECGGWDGFKSLGYFYRALRILYLSFLRTLLCYHDHTTLLLLDSSLLTERCKLHSPGLQESEIDYNTKTSPAGAVKYIMS